MVAPPLGTTVCGRCIAQLGVCCAVSAAADDVAVAAAVWVAAPLSTALGVRFGMARAAVGGAFMASNARMFSILFGVEAVAASLGAASLSGKGTPVLCHAVSG